ncbi:MAG: outer membrane beta-barrel protein [Oceanicaulis sp.]
MKINRTSASVWSLTVAAAAAFGAPAAAQVTTPDNMFTRDRNVSVMQRPRPEYDSSGVRAGAWLLRPELQTDLEWTDNVFATPSQTQSDTAISITPRVSGETMWSRHGLSFDASVTRKEYFEFDDESTTNYTLGTAGRVDVQRNAFVEAGLRYASLTEPRTSAGAAGQAAKPIEFDTLSAFAGAEQMSGRLRLRTRFDYSDVDYSDAPLFGGGVAEQGFRDRKTYVGELRGDIAISPDTAVFARLRLNNRDYRLSPPDVALNRNSSGYTIDGGFDFDIRGVARGAIGLGYTEQDYDDALIGKTSGVSIDTSVEWFPTPLTTVTAYASRSVQDAAIAGAAGYFNTDVGVSIDHELRRNVILSARAGWGEDDYSGVDRTDTRRSVSAGLTYMLNRSAGVRATYSHTDQSSSGAASGRDFTRNSVNVSLVLRR